MKSVRTWFKFLGKMELRAICFVGEDGYLVPLKGEMAENLHGWLVKFNISLTCSALDNQHMKPVDRPFRLTTFLKGDTFGVSGIDLPRLEDLEGLIFTKNC